MAAQPDDKHWFVSLNSKRYGPFTFSALTEAASRGVINPDTVVWRLGWVRWHRAGSVPGLIDKVSAKAAQSEARPETARQSRTLQAELPQAAAPIVERPAERPSSRVRPTTTSARIEDNDRQPNEEDYGQRRRKILEKYRAADEDDDEPRETERDERDEEEEEEAPRRATRERRRTLSARPPTARGDDDEEEEEIVERRATSSRTRRAAEPTALADDEDADDREDEATELEKDRRRGTLKRRQGQRAASLGRGLRDDGVDDRVEDHDEDDDDRDVGDRDGEEEMQPVLRRPPARDGRRKTPNLRLVRPSDDETDAEDEAEPDRSAAPAIKMARRAPTGPVPDLPPQIRNDDNDEDGGAKKNAQKRGGGFFGLIKRIAITILVIVLLGAVGYGTYWSGIIPKLWHLRQGATPKSQDAPSAGVMSPASLPTTPITDNSLPRDVATLPAVATLAQNDPAAFKRFVARFTAAAVNVPNDEILSVARNALRKSLKKLLANAPPDVLVDITNIYLTYMKTLQSSNAESCVALSDESKGAKLTANLAKDFPMLFVRDMTVLDRIAATDPKAVASAPTLEEARPLIESVFGALSKLPVQRDLLQREKLTPQEFSSYCDLVVAFYGAVLALPEADKVKLLRYLYATAAADDDDPPK
jgi:GYF domain 2